MYRSIRVLGIVVSLSGCAGPTGHPCAPGYGSPTSVFMLFFGRAIPARGDLTDLEWSAFLDTVVATNLPHGYTVMDAKGGWMNPISHNTIKEDSKVLLAALPDVPDSLPAIDRIRTAYRLRFDQQVVGMTVVNACGAF